MGEQPLGVALHVQEGEVTELNVLKWLPDEDRMVNGVPHRAAIVATDYGSDTLVFLPADEPQRPQELLP